MKEIHSGHLEKLLDDADAIIDGDVVRLIVGAAVIQTVLSVGGTATLVLEVSNTGYHWETLSTTNLVFETTPHDSTLLDAPWAFMRARLTEVAGGGVVNVVISA